MTSRDKECAWCGKPIPRKNKFCSTECYGLSRRKPIPYGLITPVLRAEMKAAWDANVAYYREHYDPDYEPVHWPEAEE